MGSLFFSYVSFFVCAGGGGVGLFLRVYGLLLASLMPLWCYSIAVAGPSWAIFLFVDVSLVHDSLLHWSGLLADILGFPFVDTLFLSLCFYATVLIRGLDWTGLDWTGLGWGD